MTNLQFEISARNFDLTPAIEEYVQRRLKKLERHFPHVSTPVHVVLSVDNFRYKAEGSLHLPPKKDLNAQCETKDMYASIDELAQALDNQVRKHKSEIKQKKHNGDGDIL